MIGASRITPSTSRDQHQHHAININITRSTITSTYHVNINISITRSTALDEKIMWIYVCGYGSWKHYFYPAILDPSPTLSFADQFAFRPGGSTTAALIALLRSITAMLRTNPYVVVITLDFSKAFDTVRHSTFAEKLASLDMPDCVYNWVISFLSGHSHRTVLAGDESGFEFITASFIQGSGLGPASYNVAASDLHPVTEGNEMFKFADDTDLVIPARNIDSRATEIQHVQTWATRNNLNLNCNKSYEIVFRKPRSRGTQSVVPELAGVTRVTSLKTLGVTLMNNFSMADHVSNVLASSGQSLYALRILRSNGMSEKNLQTIFCASVIAKLTYASPAWWGFANADVRGRIHAFIRRSIKAGFCPGDMPSFQELSEKSDDKLFRSVTSIETHPLHIFLPPKVARPSGLRKRAHCYKLPEKVDSLDEQNFIMRMMFKNIYWTNWTCI